MTDKRERRRQRLVNRIAHMIGEETYNHAPINYSIAEEAIAMVERSMARARRAEQGEVMRDNLADLWQRVSCPTCHATVGLACEDEDGYRQPDGPQHRARVEAFYDLTEYRGQ